MMTSIAALLAVAAISAGPARNYGIELDEDAAAAPRGRPVLVERFMARPPPFAMPEALPPAVAFERVQQQRQRIREAEAKRLEMASTSASTGLDFNLLSTVSGGDGPGDTTAEPVYRRRWMLNLHQVGGFGVLGLMTATMVTGQLNYNDRFLGGASTGRFNSAHGILAGSTVGVFAATGLLAFFAPTPYERENNGIDRVTIHKWGMITATAGMAAQAGLGIWTASREGYANQGQLAAVHLGIGYATLAAIAVAVGAMVF